MANIENITEKVYKKLLLQVGLNGFSFAVLDTLIQRIELVREIDFSQFAKSNKVEDYYWKAFLDNRELTKIYDEVRVIHNNNWNTFVPKSLFEPDFLSSYLQYNTKVFETDTFVFDILNQVDINNVFVPHANINNYLLEQFDTFDYKHCNTILVEKLLELSKNIEETQMYVHCRETNLEIVVIQNQKLLFFNTFETTTKEDFIYYLLFTIEQLQLNPENLKLQFLGKINVESPLYKIAYQYIRYVSLLNINDLQKHNNFSISENLHHFILLQS